MFASYKGLFAISCATRGRQSQRDDTVGMCWRLSFLAVRTRRSLIMKDLQASRVTMWELPRPLLLPSSPLCCTYYALVGETVKARQGEAPMQKGEGPET